MTAVNFMINSDFKWVLLGMELLWACSLLLFVWEVVRSSGADHPALRGTNTGAAQV